MTPDNIVVSGCGVFMPLMYTHGHLPHGYASVMDNTLLTIWGFSYSRAVGAGPAGPAAAGPIFGQLTCTKMPYELC